MKKIIIIVPIVISVILAVGISYMLMNEPKTVFVDLTKLHDEFTLKIELETKFTYVQQRREAILDSMKLELTILSRELERINGKDINKLNIYELKRENYLQKAEIFNEDNNIMIEQYDGQIWIQLNQYVEEYGEKMSYAFILGAKGDGNLMYTDEKYDITDELILYVNERYSGKTDFK